MARRTYSTEEVGAPEGRGECGGRAVHGVAKEKEGDGRRVTMLGFVFVATLPNQTTGGRACCFYFFILAWLVSDWAGLGIDSFARFLWVSWLYVTLTCRLCMILSVCLLHVYVYTLVFFGGLSVIYKQKSRIEQVPHRGRPRGDGGGGGPGRGVTGYNARPFMGEGYFPSRGDRRAQNQPETIVCVLCFCVFVCCLRVHIIYVCMNEV